MSATDRRELNHRASNGIQVTLFWTRSTNRVTVEVLGADFGDGLEFDVQGTDALDAFNHPYAYAASRPIRSLATEARALAA